MHIRNVGTPAEIRRNTRHVSFDPAPFVPAGHFHANLVFPKWLPRPTLTPDAGPTTPEPSPDQTPGLTCTDAANSPVVLARWWHFNFDLLWLINGVLFYVLLFSIGQCLLPRSWDVVPDAVSVGIQYLSLDLPANEGWTQYNGLTVLTILRGVRRRAAGVHHRSVCRPRPSPPSSGWLGPDNPRPR